MKNVLFLALIFNLVFITSCGDDEEPTLVFDYSNVVNSPDSSDKNVDDTIDISIDFESATGEPVHHVNVRIYNVATNEEVYNMPTDAHVHDLSGKFTYTDSFVLSNANGVMAHSDWMLETKVWGHEAGAEEVIESIPFHVHP